MWLLGFTGERFGMGQPRGKDTRAIPQQVRQVPLWTPAYRIRSHRGRVPADLHLRGGLDLTAPLMGFCGPGDLKCSSCIGFSFGLLELFELIFPHKESYLGRFMPCFCLCSTSHRFFHLNYTAFFP